MSGYCTVDQVMSRNTGRTVDVGSNPTTADVQTYIDWAGAEIDAILINKGYQLPVDQEQYPAAYTFLGGINAIGGWAFMEESAPTSINLDRAQKAWTEAKATLIDAEQVMDLPKDSRRASPRGPGLTRPPAGIPGDSAFFTRDQCF